MKKKFYVAKETTNRISYRALSSFESRNPSIFELSHSAHETWEEARKALLYASFERTKRAERELKSARLASQKILAMEKP